MEWKLIKTDGNPPKEDVYQVILLHPDKTVTKRGKEMPADDAKYTASIDMRFYGGRPALTSSSWAMIDQDEKAPLYWQEESGSRICETVYAWLDTSDVELPKLPDGVEWEDD